MGCDWQEFKAALTAEQISIHAARMGCDPRLARDCILRKYFNPRSPNGLRLSHCTVAIIGIRFQSTQPEWAATHNW